MPKIINAYSDANNSIADSLKSIGQSIWGDEAKNEGLRQNAEKVRQEAAKAARENTNAEPYARALRDNDAGATRYYGALHGLPPAGIASGNLLATSGQANGNPDYPELGTAMMGAGHPIASTAEGQNRALNASRYTPVMGEDRYGTKTPAGAFNTRTGEYAPFGQPDPSAQPPAAGPNLRPTPAQPGFGAPAPRGTPQVGYQPAAAYEMPAGQPTGGEYLQTLPPGQASLLVGILDGRAPPPTGNALLAKRNQHLLEDLALVEPGFDLTKWVERYKTAQDFSSGGKSGQAVKSANQAITHLGGLVDAAEGLHNREGFAAPVLNQVGNAAAEFMGKPGAQPFEMARNAFADEIAKVFRTTGMSDHEIAQWHNTMNSSQSPTQIHASVAKAMELYHGAVDALEQNRTRGMGTFRQQSPLLDPSTMETMNRINAWTKGGKWQPAPAQAGPQPAQALPPGPTGHPPSFNDRFESAQPGAAAPQAPAAAPQPAQGVDPKAIQYLQQHPETRAFFDQKYGAGASARILGQ